MLDIKKQRVLWDLENPQAPLLYLGATAQGLWVF